MRLIYFRAFALKVRFLITARYLLIRHRLFKDQRSLIQLERLCKTILDRVPKSYMANFYLAMTLRKQGRLDEAAEVYRRIPGLPGSKFFLDTLDLLWVLYEAKRHDEVIARGEEALRKLNSGSLGLDRSLMSYYLDTTHRMIGVSYAELGDYERAIPHLEIACKLDKATYPEKFQQLLQQCRESLEHQRLEGASEEPGEQEDL